VTVNDVIEAMIGDIEDEFDEQDDPQIVEKQDGSLIVDARVDIDEFEDQYGRILTEDERDEVETLGGLAFALAGRVPARGELLKHASGMVIEVLDGDARRVNRLRLRGLPAQMRSDDV
jgi:CBS domain containing-hemolysin-like protein